MSTSAIAGAIKRIKIEVSVLRKLLCLSSCFGAGVIGDGVGIVDSTLGSTLTGCCAGVGSGALLGGVTGSVDCSSLTSHTIRELGAECHET